MRPYLSNNLNNEFPFLKGMWGKGCSISCDDGWYPILHNAFTKIVLTGEEVTVFDIKEKWGSLRVSFVGGERSEAIIDELEKQSATVCECCGLPGKVRLKDGWYKAVCPDCDKLQSNLTVCI
jgi:hypothetical protein